MAHDFNLIIDRMPKDLNIPHAEALEDFTEFVTIRRYEEGSAIFEPEEIQTAIEVARAVLNWAQKIK